MPTLVDPLRSFLTRERLRSLSAFATVGVAGVAVNQGLLVALVHFDVAGYLLAMVVATQAAILFNFALLERWVFDGGDGADLGRRLGRYWLVSNAFLVIGVPLLAVLVSGVGVQYALANLLVIGTQFALRFVVSDRLIWSSSDVVSAPSVTA